MGYFMSICKGDVMSKPDPSKAVVVKPGKRSVGKAKAKVSAWTPVSSDVAKYDEWGIALRTLKENGINVR
jgi:hypothetical protein